MLTPGPQVFSARPSHIRRETRFDNNKGAGIHMKRNRESKKYQYLIIFTVVVYAALLLSVVIFKTLASPMDLFTGNHPDYRSLNLIPFKDMWDPNLSAGFNETSIMGNVILFVPLGLLLKLLLSEQKHNTLKSALIVLAASLLIESTQYLARIGVSDVNDVILNTAGGGIGILISAALMKWPGKSTAKKIIAVSGAAVAVMMIVWRVLLFLAN